MNSLNRNQSSVASCWSLVRAHRFFAVYCGAERANDKIKSKRKSSQQWEVPFRLLMIILNIPLLYGSGRSVTIHFTASCHWTALSRPENNRSTGMYSVKCCLYLELIKYFSQHFVRRRRVSASWDHFSCIYHFYGKRFFVIIWNARSLMMPLFVGVRTEQIELLSHSMRDEMDFSPPKIYLKCILILENVRKMRFKTTIVTKNWNYFLAVQLYPRFRFFISRQSRRAPDSADRQHRTFSLASAVRKFLGRMISDW